MNKIIVFVVLSTIFIFSLFAILNKPDIQAAEDSGFVFSHTVPRTTLIDNLMETATEFVVAKHKQTGGSQHSYDEYVAEYMRGIDLHLEDAYYFKGSQLVLVRLEVEGDNVNILEKILINSPDGFLRDPDISPDGRNILFSWKKDDTDDFSIYEMNISSGDIRQITFGSGIADTDARYLPNGNIVFNSTRGILTVPCWHIPVSNLYIMGPNGEDIVRLGFDQVHTTYPVLTSDGRIIYTRWDYNDRNQMYSRGIFQMLTDGTNQLEMFANNQDFPTSLLHTREVPGRTDRYISIASGHHTLQAGKLVWLDVPTGRNNADAVKYVFESRSPDRIPRVDHFGQQGPLYKFPFALNDHEILVSHAPGGWASNDNRAKARTVFSIYLIDTITDERIILVNGTEDLPASQIVPITTRSLQEKVSNVDYSSTTGVYMISDVYEGDGMIGVEHGEAKYLRVIEVVYRPYAIGATIAFGGERGGTSDPFTPVSAGNASWDIKNVLGIVPIQEDGSVMFRVPSNTPVYFQILNERGEVIQTMRSWSTLMPNETLSCIGCHADKNFAPPSHLGFTMAMGKGVMDLQPDLWMDSDIDPYINRRNAGFSYLEEIQPILDNNCISCHSNDYEATNRIHQRISPHDEIIEILPIQSENWRYMISSFNGNTPPNDWFLPGFDDSAWQIGRARFGSDGEGRNTNWSGDNSNIWIRREFEISLEDYNNMQSLYLNIFYDEDTVIYINGKEVLSFYRFITQYEYFTIPSGFLRPGKNTIAVHTMNTIGGAHIDVGLYASTQISEPVSLESTNINVSRSLKNWPLSYFVLTGGQILGDNIVARPSNGITNFLPSMSPAAVLEPYSFGSSRSYLIRILRNEIDSHPKVNLTEAEIRAFAAWIDLGAPAFGSYNESAAWGQNEQRVAQENINKREFYDTLDDYSHMARAGIFTDNDNFELSLSSSDEIFNINGNGYAVLNLPKALQEGDTITVKLPADVHYINFGISSRFGTALIYVPGDTFTYTMPRLSGGTFPGTMNPRTTTTYFENTIFVGVATERQLSQRRNLARNQFALTNEFFPYASALSERSASSAGNAIDGYKITSQSLAGSIYPTQSWRPQREAQMTVNFGRNVYADAVSITLSGIVRSLPNSFTTATLEFSNGKTQTVNISLTRDTQYFSFDPVEISWININLDSAQIARDDFDGLAQIEVFGHIRPPGPIDITAVNTSNEFASDGKIIGTNSEMEYRTVSGQYTSVNANEITGLRPGTYYVRYMATEGGQPSQDTRIRVY